MGRPLDMSPDDWVGSPEWLEDVKGRAERRLAKIDDLSAGVRAVIHEYGWGPVNELLLIGVTKPQHLRHICHYFRHEYGRVPDIGRAA